jgi:SAM-dependent methyltransferase
LEAKKRMDSPHEHNRRAWDSLVQKGQAFTKPAADGDFVDPLRTVDQLGWLAPGVRGKNLLCLAAGGGKHGPLYATAGANVTVVDISPAMLQLDRQVAAERSLSLRVIEASMDSLGMLIDGEFDIVIHPVSTCYVPHIAPVYREVARVLRAGGLYISQHKTPQNLQAEQHPSRWKGYELAEPYYRNGPLPAVHGSRLREEGTREYLHRWEEIVGELCRSGFVIEDLVEPRHATPDASSGTFAHRASYIAPYVRIKARRVGPEVPQRLLLTLP